MKFKILSLALAVNALSGIAIADTVTTPAPSSTAATKSTYDWTGVYVGGFVGGATGSNVTSSEPYNSQEGYWNINGANNNYSTKASFMGGGTVGYNWQIGKSPYLVGLEGEYGYLGQSGSNTDPNATTYNASPASAGYPTSTGSSSTKIGSSYGYGLVGGRIGYAMDRALFYVKSGAVFTSNQSSYNDSNWGFTGSSKTNNNPGYAIGAGVEYALPTEWFKLAKNISIKTEYLYFGINRTTTTTSSSYSEGWAGQQFSSNTSISGIHTAKIGVNYKF